MHEMAIAQNILDIAVAAAQRGGAKRIGKINVVAGELRGIVPTQLTFCFGIAAQDTIASDAYLSFETVPVTAKCTSCDEAFTVEDFFYTCPRCESTDVEVTGGTELRVRDIEVD